MMVQDKSLFYYGSLYHRLIDSITQKHRNEIVDHVRNGSYVLDVGSGTGELALVLHRRKRCRVVGIDLSQKMIDFANNRNPYEDVVFEHGDATRLQDFEDDQFEFGCTCMVLHELPPDYRLAALKELLRVAERLVLLDYNCPLPSNGPSAISRLIESTLGRDHHSNFKNYLATGGLMAVLEKAAVESHIVSRSIINNGTHQLIVLSSERFDKAGNIT